MPSDRAIVRALSAPWMRGVRASGMGVALVASLVHVLLRPDSVDLATGQFRAHLFERGAYLWNNHWFGGHPLPGSGGVAPALNAVFGVEWVAIASVLVSSWCFAVLVERWIAVRPDLAHPRVAAALFALGCAENLWGGRIAFTVSLAFVLVCVLLLHVGRPWSAGVAGVLAALSSPVGALALLVVLAALWCAADLGRVRVAAVGVVTAVPAAAVVVLFPEGGWYPFTFGRFAINIAVIAVVAWYGRDVRVVRWLAVVYGLTTVGAFLVRSPLGGNVSRIAWVGAAGLAALVIREHRRSVMPVFVGVVLVWGWSFVGMAFVSNSPTADAAYYTPLRDQLLAIGGPLRVEVVPTSTYLQADVVALEVPIARGWLTQLDRELNPIFYDERLTDENFRRWLLERSVTHVALPLDDIHSKSEDEAAIVARSPGYLREVWSSADWRLFEVVDAEPLSGPEVELLDVGYESLTVRITAAGTHELRYRYSHLYRVEEGAACIGENDEGWLLLTVDSPTTLRLEVTGTSVFDAFGGGDDC